MPKPSTKSSSPSYESSHSENGSKSIRSPLKPDEEVDDSSSDDEEMILAQNAGWDEDDSSDDEDDKPPAKKSKTTSSTSSPSAPNAEATTNVVEFNLEEMGDHFYNSLRTFLGRSPLLSKNLSLLTTSIINQVSVGTVVSQSVESAGAKSKGKKGKYDPDMTEDPNNRGAFAFTTVLNTTDEEVEKIIPEIINVAHSATEKVKPFVSTDSKCGLLITRSMINVPHNIIHEMHKCLRDDVMWAQKNATGDNGEERKLYDFKRLLVIAEVDVDQKSGNYGISQYAKKWKVPELKRMEEEFILSRSEFEPTVFSVKGIDETGEKCTVKYVVGGVKWGKYADAIEEFGAMLD
ncbi:hypothetical protein TrLO_g11391 [Triparma laevis f. longispina]|uniref:Uncharacterized protein n=1 Tax=Triparma laevis f. longispina TaxID=1714387 RepID=A0A9W7C202_9STRA|nr:hypothetical protein TrLO_g11391 [Triparma laevis f. longispina]